MSLALDTDVLIHWFMTGAPQHRAVRAFLDQELDRGVPLALGPQVLYEFLHVATDPRRFQNPLPMDEALDLVRHLWQAPETHQLPTAAPPDRVTTLMHRHFLGRKRILDTALAATLEAARIHRLATFNRRDFEVFGFLEVVEPVVG
ncbi:MAG: TA system VapC family ribonuclease toxin [Acidobacteriota bacterium]|nr:TA system VapC family ribonuclease toxin [Acidobacteriota bacterium]